MKNEKGITLVALIIIICLLFIFSGAAIYTSVKSYEVIDIQKYKVQMQAIQSALDEFYEDFEADYEKNKIDLQNIPNDLNGDNTINPETEVIHIDEKQEYMDYYVEYIASSRTGSIIDLIKNMENNNAYIRNLNRFSDISNPATVGWWTSVAGPIFDISIEEDSILQQYYYMSKMEVEELLGVKDIDISENFIINFENRYVFSETPISVKSGDSTENVYCLYQLNEEEKVVEFKMTKTDGYLDVEIIERNLNYQIVKIKLNGSQETKIKQVYAQDINDLIIDGEEGLLETSENEEKYKIENQKKRFSDIQGIGTDEVTFKVIDKGNYFFIARDFFDGEYTIGLTGKTTNIVLYEPPVLEDDMIPFEPVIMDDGGIGGKIFLNDGRTNLNDWYDYSDNKYATVVIANLTQNGNLNEYNKNNVGKTFTINQYNQYVEYVKDEENGTHIVKVWIPKKLWKENNNICSSLGNIDFINKTGVWVTAKWEGGKWVPDAVEKLTPTVESFSRNKLLINLSSSDLKYYWKINDDANIDYTSNNGEILRKNGNSTIKTNIIANYSNNKLELTDNNNNILQNIRSVSIYGIAPNGNKTTIKTIRRKEEDISNYNLIKNGSFEDGFNYWGMGQATGTGHEISTQYSLYGGKSFKKPPTTPVPYNYITQEPGFILNNNYYVYIHAYNPSTTFSNVNFDIGNAGYTASKNINKGNGWTRVSLIYPSDGVDRNIAVNYIATTVDTYIDEVGVIDLTQLQSNNSYLKIQNDSNWCDHFIDTKDGKIILNYYE